MRAGFLAWAALYLPLAAAAQTQTPAAQEPAQTQPWRPKETADASLITENVAWSRYLHDALALPEWLDVAVEQRTRFEYLAQPFRGGEPGTQTQYPIRSRLRIGVDAPGGFRFLAELQDSRVFGDGPNDFTGSEQDRLSFAQLFASYTKRELFGTALRADVHVGRMSLDFGSRRLIARNGYRNTTNAFDGVHLALGDPAAWRVRAFYVEPVILDERAWEDKSYGSQRLWGTAFEDKHVPWLNFDVYYFGLHDRRTNGSTLGRSYETFGARALRVPKLDQWDYELEAMGQFGQRTITRGGVPTQLDQQAFYGHAELGYTFAVPWSPRLVGQFDYASGNPNPTGDDSGTFDPLFGARRGDLIATGIYGPFRRSNILSAGGRLLIVPRPDLKAWLKVRYWQLAQSKDTFAGNGLTDASGDAGDKLGTDIELSAQWTPAPWLTLETGYDHWFKGSYLNDVPEPAAGPISVVDSDYVYVSVMVRL